jgi:hypothetical protein
MDGETEQTFTDSTPVTKDITVYAKFKGNEYSATFKWWNDKTSGPFTVEYPDPLSKAAGFTLPVVGTRANYTDNGGGKWYFDNVAVDGDTVLTGSITAIPVWTGESYTVTFHHNDGTEGETSITTVSVKYTDGDMAASPEVKVPQVKFPTLSWTNHIFDDWRTEKAAAGNKFAAGAVINGDTDVYAHWMGLSGSAALKYGSLTTTNTTVTVGKTTNTVTGALKVPSFVVIGTDTVKTTISPTSTAGTITPLEVAITNDSTSVTVTSPTSNKQYTYTINTSKKTVTATQMATGGTFEFLKTGSGASAKWDEVHTFTSSSTLMFNSNRLPSGLQGQVLVVAGGGGGGMGAAGTENRGGGGGGGGVIFYDEYPLNLQSYSVKVGAGGASATTGTGGNTGSPGGDSTFGNDFTATGGGGGASSSSSTVGGSGGSGGGSTGKSAASTSTATSQTAPDKAKKYGNVGGNTTDYDSAANGGGGAGGTGGKVSAAKTGAMGGIGILSSITGATVYYGGGGAGGWTVKPSITSDGHKYGAYGGADGAANTGDGGCGGDKGNDVAGTKGGSGIVVVRFPFSE